ncbi:MAG: YeeE/YedE family protein [Rhodovibrio sp.]|nr:YeeE/YedE family protein [Rhodovibrio sp.]
MDLYSLFVLLLENLGDGETLLLAGLVVGIVFGVAAQRSRFCLRAAVVEFSGGRLGPRTAVWLLCFSTALVWTQAAALAGLVDLSTSRWLGQASSLSGAVIGGLVFGVGMVLARGCPGRLLVLSATGNLRAILSGLVFAVTAQVTLRGLMAPARQELAGLSTTQGPTPSLQALGGLPDWTGLALGCLFTMAALWFARANQVGPRVLVFGSGVGFAAALAWFFTYQLSQLTFQPTSVESLSFSGPSADVLMFVLQPDGGVDFDIGLVPGVFVGAFLAALAARELAWQGWEGARAMQRYLLGAVMMGFGAMLAGGCSIGAGVSGASTLALTAWVALASMWLGGTLADHLVDRRAAAAAPSA